jgi:alanyl-tRNA synthetase
MTERLYYLDSALREFDGTVVAVEQGDEAIRIRLDRTAFYPTSGGQPFDTGVLAGLKVVDVVDDDDGVVHVLGRPGPVDPARQVGPIGPALRSGQTVHGAIDWPRRFDHMQQHTGQHVLSAAFDRLFGARTISFHLGTDLSTIDFAREMTPAEISAAEAEANRVVWDDRPVGIRFVTAEEAATLPLRKEPVREGTLRIVDIDGFDVSACGGTHVPRTGAIGLIAIAGIERFKGGQRVEFVCGNRALARFRLLRDTAAACGRLLSAAPADLAGSIERLQAEIKEQRRSLFDLQNEAARFQADTLSASAEAASVGRIVRRALPLDAVGLKALASAITSRGGMIAILASTTAPVLVVVARSQDVTLDANAVVKALTAEFGGRGGGKADLAQAGGLSGQPEQILERSLARIQQV